VSILILLTIFFPFIYLFFWHKVIKMLMWRLKLSSKYVRDFFFLVVVNVQNSSIT